MSQASLRSVTLDTVDNYRQVATHAIDAYRASGHRLLSMMNQGVDRAAARGAERLAPRLAAVLRSTGHQFTSVAAKGIDGVSASTGRVVELGSAGVRAQVGRVANLVEGIENRYIATGLQAAARLSLTGAQAALSLSEKLAAGASRLSTAVEPKPTAPVAVKKAVKVVARRAKRVVAKAPVAKAPAAKPAARTRRAA